jgi:queuine tRNA-ribosyltransferase
VHPVRIELEAVAGTARAGVATTARGTYRTPCFMPVGTRGAIKYLSAADYEALGVEIVLGNTYHLMLRPGAETVARFGGLGRFSGWPGVTLTDSGGFQIFSLEPKVDDDGVTFRSVYDGSTHRLTPESTVATQELLGADIQMVLDVCPPLPSPHYVVDLAVERTAAWAARARAAHCREDQALFGIAQGGVDEALRTSSARRTADLDFDGYGIGGLSVGETRAEMLPALAAALAELPADRPRYLMGVGDPASLVESIALGVDQFDCVMQTRLGRHGTAFTDGGKVHVKAARHGQEDEPLDARCGCQVCARHSRGYLRHLFSVGEPTASRLVSYHNIAWTLDLMARSRASIVAGTFEALRREILAVWA